MLTADGSVRVTSGQLNPVRVTDTRAGNPGWNLTGQVSDFTSGAARFSGSHLRRTPHSSSR
ncbi:hypothetical protein [Actinocrispum sp. NPDC049592]|uniref:hypothetical protein n=1 Tax=Actinocrispum sp. NPDC049592 TaxID=3154835 RepID=UPI00342550E7